MFSSARVYRCGIIGKMLVNCIVVVMILLGSLLFHSGIGCTICFGGFGRGGFPMIWNSAYYDQ